MRGVQMAPAAGSALLGAAREPCRGWVSAVVLCPRRLSAQHSTLRLTVLCDRETTTQSEGNSVQICSIVVIFRDYLLFCGDQSHDTSSCRNFWFAKNTRTSRPCLLPPSSAALACLLSG